jgi:hypothetical protein
MLNIHKQRRLWEWQKLNLSYDRRSVSPGVGTPSGLVTNFSFSLKFSLDSCGFVILLRPLWQEDGSVIYCCCWSRQHSTVRVWIPRGSRPYFIVAILETPPTWRARPPYLYLPGTGWPSYTPGHWVPFRRLLRLAGLLWRYSIPLSHGKTYLKICKNNLWEELFPCFPLLPHEPHRKRLIQ